MSKNDYSGICIITGSDYNDLDNVLTNFSYNYVDERFEETGEVTFLINEPSRNINTYHSNYSDTIKKAEQYVIDVKHHCNYVIVTTDMFFIRAIEVMCDINKCMKRLNVYDLDQAKVKGNIDTAPNLTYSEYGVSELYEKMQRGFYILDELLKQKHNIKED